MVLLRNRVTHTPRPRAAWAVALPLLLAAVAVTGWLRFREPRAGNVTYKIGWQVSPPYQINSNGTPAGLAVDLVREAARRRGIKLQWVFWEGSSENALANRAVDLWPLMTITAERRKIYHFSEPYLETEHTLIVPADSPYHRVSDLANASISFANTSFADRLLGNLMPQAQRVGRPNPRDALEEVCTRRVDAAFLEVYNAIAGLLENGVCASHPLRWIGIPHEERSSMGICSTFEASAAADALREEIGAMAREGGLAPIVGKWGYTPGQNLESMAALVDARRNVARSAAVAVLSALFLLLTCLQTVRIGRDRNRLRQTGQALRAAEQKLRLMANNLKEMVLAYDMDRRLIYANPAVESLTGYKVSELEKEGFINWVHPDDRHRMIGYWDGLFEGNAFQEEEYRLITKDGGIKWAAATWGPLLDEEGRQVGVQGCERDITEHRALQERYLHAQKMESIGRLAGGVAHDFNNLLTVINGYGDLLLGELKEDDPLHDPVSEIRRAGERAKDLTRGLLTFSRKQVTEPRVLDLNDLIREHLDMLGRLVGEDIEVTTQLEPGLGHVLADPNQLHQVLMNLAVNARDSMPEGGTLTLRTENVDLGSARGAEGSDLPAGPYVVLTVSDTGTGIKDEIRPHIFDPFFTTKGKGQGTGLGLATVYGIVRQSGGAIAVRSEVNRGTAFDIYLPRTEKPAAAAGDKRGDAGPRGSETILLVEDQEAVRQFISSILSRQGYQVLEAATGTEALETAEGHAGPIHLLLTDVIMPGMTGKELAERLKGPRPATKVLYMSGYAADLMADRGLLGPGVGYIAKPFSPESLNVKVREVLEPVPSGPKVLVVDDEAGVRQFFQKILAGAGYDVVTAGSGEEALRIARQQTLQLVITDLVMPEVEGIETIRTIRKEQPRLKIIATSGAFGGTYLETARLLGANTTLPKPVSAEQLLAAARDLLS